jgi:hypothetical protein
LTTDRPANIYSTTTFLRPALPGGFYVNATGCRATPVLDATGRVQFIIQSVHDITMAAWPSGNAKT